MVYTISGSLKGQLASMSITEILLLRAIQKKSKRSIQRNSVNIALKHFVLEHLEEISPSSLEYLYTEFKMDLNLYSESHVRLSKAQMQVLLKYHFLPSEQMILTYSAYFDLSLFKLLIGHNIEIPSKIVYEWRTLPYAPALCYYLKHNGNPNIRPFQFSDKYDIFHPSLVDSWIALQESPGKSKSELEKINKVVNMLKEYGAIPSPCAMTYKQKEIYNTMMLESPKNFILTCNKKIDCLTKKLDEIEKNNGDDSLYEEYLWSIKRYEQDIENARSLK